jgi:Flp pilus assembly protein TadG
MSIETVTRVKKRPLRQSRGSSLVEFALMFPMLFFLLLGIVDMGIYCYSLVCVQDATRMTTLFASSSIGNGNTAAACQYLLTNLSKLPNVNGTATCNGGSNGVTLTVASVTGPDSPDSNPAVKVTVSYRTINLIPIYGLPGQLTITRSAQARMRS